MGVGMVTYSPTAGGLLTGKWAPARRPDSGRMATNEMYKMRYGDPAHYVVAAGLGASPTSWQSIPPRWRWHGPASHPAVTLVLLGARDVGQLDDVLGAAAIS